MKTVANIFQIFLVMQFSTFDMEKDAFIKSFKRERSHYCRNSSARQYLGSELSINKLFRIYNEQAAANLKVKRTFFWKIFSTKFNIFDLGTLLQMLVLSAYNWD